MAHDVFVSYSNRDKLTADAVVARLEAAKLRCWIAPRDILPGMEWGEAIIDGINRSRLMVLVFSSSANASPQIRREVERAVNKGLPIIPFRIEEVLPSRSLEYFLSSPHWLDALTPPVEAHIQKLADSIKTLLARLDGDATQAAPPAPPPARARVRVQKVIDTMLGRPPKVVNTGSVPGLAPAPHGARRRVAPQPAPPATPRSLIIAVGVLLVIAILVFLLPRKAPAPSTGAPAGARIQPTVPPAAPAPQPTLPPMTGYDPSANAPSAAAASQAPSTSAAQKASRVAATYECRTAVKFSIEPDTAGVSMDGRNIGIAESFYHRAYPLRPGTHYAKLTLRGYRTETIKILVRSTASDDNADIKLKLRPSS